MSERGNALERPRSGSGNPLERRANANHLEHGVRVRAAWLALGVGTAIFAGKLGLTFATGSTAVFSDAMESIVNVAAGALLLYTLIVAARPADRDHPYGHGKVEFFSAGAEGTLIAVAALAIWVEAARDLWRGPALEQIDLGILGVAALAGANALLGGYLIRTGRLHHSEALVADGRHLMTDVVTSVGVVFGLVAVRVTGLVWLDPVVAIGVGANVLRTGYQLVRSAVGGLMDEADESLLAPICEALEKERRPWWIDVHSLRTFRSGAVQHTDLHLSVPRYYDADRLHRIGDAVHDAVLGATGLPGDVIVHFDPCRPRQCPTCPMPDCPVRVAAFVDRPPITLDTALRGDERLDTGEPLPPEPAA